MVQKLPHDYGCTQGKPRSTPPAVPTSLLLRMPAHQRQETTEPSFVIARSGAVNNARRLGVRESCVVVARFQARRFRPWNASATHIEAQARQAIQCRIGLFPGCDSGPHGIHPCRALLQALHCQGVPAVGVSEVVGQKLCAQSWSNMDGKPSAAGRSWSFVQRCALQAHHSSMLMPGFVPSTRGR